MKADSGACPPSQFPQTSNYVVDHGERKKEAEIKGRNQQVQINLLCLCSCDMIRNFSIGDGPIASLRRRRRATCGTNRRRTEKSPTIHATGISYLNKVPLPLRRDFMMYEERNTFYFICVSFVAEETLRRPPIIAL